MQYIKIILFLIPYTINICSKEDSRAAEEYMSKARGFEAVENLTPDEHDAIDKSGKNLKVNKLYVEGKAKFEEDVKMEDNLRVDRNISTHRNLFVKKKIEADKIKAHKASFCDATIGCSLIVEPGASFSVGGNEFIAGNLTVLGNESIGGTLTVGTISVGSLIANSLSVCDLTIGCSLITEPTASVNLEGNVTIGETLFVTDDVSLGGNLSVGGNEFLTGNESIGGNLSVAGIASINSIVVSNLSLTGNEFIGGNLSIVGNENLNGNLSVGGNTSIVGNEILGGTLSVGGNLSVSGIGSFTGSLIAGCDLSVGCNIDMLNSADSAHGNILKAGTRFVSNFGTGNTFVGASSGNFALTGTDNTGVGADALTADTSGSSNTAVGTAALIVNTTGGSNVAVGNGALVALTTGSDNIALGTSAGALLTTSSDNIEIGNVGVLGDSGVIRIGTNGTHTTAFIQGIFGVTSAGATAVVINAAGQLGTVISSARFKENIKKLDLKRIFDLIDALDVVSFNYKSDSSKKEQLGMIAEQVAQVFPEFVAYDNDGKPFSVRYDLLSVLAIGAISHMKSMLNDQDIRLERIEMLVNSLLPKA